MRHGNLQPHDHTTNTTMHPCPCKSGKAYRDCCEPYLNDSQYPPTALALMRSRYTAYTKSRIDYIITTQTGPGCQHFNKKSASQWSQQANWIGLKIIAAPTPEADQAEVHFVATYELDGIKQLEEKSTFKRTGGRWKYLLKH